MARFSFLLLNMAVLFLSCNNSIGHKMDQEGDGITPGHTNYGYNIVVVSDLSNRILNNRSYEDPAVLALITTKLKDLFQKSADVNINSKFYFTTVNDQDFDQFTFNDSIFKIDLTRFNKNITKRAEYLHHSKGKGSLQYDISVLNKSFAEMYEKLKSGKQVAADMWYFVKDKLTYPVIDTGSTTFPYKGGTITNKLRNYVIIVTDGYIEAGRYGGNKDMKQGNKYRYLSESLVNVFRNEFRKSNSSSASDFFIANRYGVLPVQNPFLAECKFLILELFDRSVKNGVNTQNPTDMEIMKLFWTDWLVKSNVDRQNISIYPSFNNRQNLDQVLVDFFK